MRDINWPAGLEASASNCSIHVLSWFDHKWIAVNDFNSVWRSTSLCGTPNLCLIMAMSTLCQDKVLVTKLQSSPNANHDAMLIAITKEEETWADWLSFGLPHKIYTNTLYCMHLVARYQIYMLIGLCRNYKLIWCFFPWLIIVVELLKVLWLYVWYPRKLPLLPISW